MKTATLELLDTDIRTVLLTLNARNVGIFSYQLQAGAQDAVRKVNVQCYVEQWILGAAAKPTFSTPPVGPTPPGLRTRPGN